MKKFKATTLALLLTATSTTMAGKIDFFGSVVNPMCPTTTLSDKKSASGFSVACTEANAPMTITIEETPFAQESGIFDNAVIVNTKTNKIIEKGVKISEEDFTSGILMSVKQKPNESERIYRVVSINYK